VELDSLRARRDEFAAGGRTAIVVAVDGRAAGVLGLADAPRDTAAAAVRALHQAGVEEARIAVDKAAGEVAAAASTRDQKAGSLQLDVDQSRRGLDTARAAAAQHARDLQNDVDQANARVAEDQRRLSADKSRLSADRKQLQNSQREERRAEDRVQRDRDRIRRIEDRRREKGCDSTPSNFSAAAAGPRDPSPPTTRPPNTTTSTAPPNTTTSTAPPNTTTSTAPPNTTTTRGPTTTTIDQKECNNLADEEAKARNDLAADEEALSAARSDTARFDANVREDEALIQADEQKLADDTKAVADARDAQAAGGIEDQTSIQEADKALADALDAQATGKLENQQAVDRAGEGVAGARAALGTKTAEQKAQEQPTSPGEIAAQEAEVAGAAAKATTAERTLAETTLVAPADGTVAVIASKVGEHVAGAGVSGTEATAAGAAAGDRTGAGSAGPPNARAPGSVSGRSGGFITLTDLGSLLVKAPFSETDAARVHPGQAAKVTFDALSGKVVSARVAVIDTVETVVNNVVNYNVTVLLEDPAVGIKPGMTASVEVVVAEKLGVLRLPASVLSPRNGVATVKVLEGGKPVSRTVSTGLKGDDDIEIIGGLKEGDKVIVARRTPVEAMGGQGNAGGGQ
jgi:multidrug efflux pump subunit AcrA (membrane-fusion protein)